MIIIEIFRLFGSVFVDNEKANKAIDDTDSKGKGLASTLGGMIGTAAKVGAGIVAGVAAGGSALFALANKTAEAADAIDKLSERTGINREELQRWQYAAGQSGADVEKLEVGIKKLSDVMDGALSGSKANIESFQKLGISLDDLRTKSQSEIFDKVMASLADMEQGAARNALGNDLLGKSYTEMLPLLNAGSAGMDELKKRADELGLVMSEDAVKANVKFGDTLSDVKQALGAVGMHISNLILPAFQSMLDWVLAHMPEIQAIFQKVFEAVSFVVTTAYNIFNEHFLPILQDLYNFIKPYIPEIQDFIIHAFTEVFNIVQRVWNLFEISLLPILKTLFNFVKPAFPAIASIIKGAFDTVIGVANGVINVFETVVGWITKAIDVVKKFTTASNDVTTPDSVFGVTGYASGTNYATPGWHLVGENGLELVRFRGGEEVLSNQESRELLSQSTELTVNVPLILDGQIITSTTSRIQVQKNNASSRALGVVLV